MQPNFPELEQEVLERWKKDNTFTKTLEKTKGGKPFVFYEGPPTANAKPGIHHVLARAFKDVICRFKTMQGLYVERKAGWDTHGLPVELAVEKKLGLKSKADIESIDPTSKEASVAKFNAECKASVWEYKEEWERLTERMGYWLDLEHPYITYSPDYIEKLWGVIKKIDKRKLLQPGRRVTPFCWRCGTNLSSHELAQGYKTVKDTSVYVRFELNNEPGTFLVVWTTTPWTLPSNVALAVNENVEYVKINIKGKKDLPDGKYILAKSVAGKKDDPIGNYFYPWLNAEGESNNRTKPFLGKELIGQGYKPLYKDFYSNSQTYEVYDYQKAFSEPEIKQTRFSRAFKIYPAKFVTETEGSGILHISPAHGEEDFQFAIDNDIPGGSSVTEQGIMKKGAPGAGLLFTEANKKVIEDLGMDKGKEEGGKHLLRAWDIEHEYPFCWRCDSRLIYLARSQWFILMSKLRQQLIENNSGDGKDKKPIHWVPSHIKDGRFGGWLEEVKDWAFSRERYWGTPLPIWECEKKHRLVVGSYDEFDKHAPKRGKVFLMRHGQAENNAQGIVSSFPEKKGYPLTEEGRAQAEKAAESLKSMGIERIIASPVLRTQQTAEIVGKALGIPVETDPRLQELGFGVFNGASHKDFIAASPWNVQRYTKTVEGGEDLRSVKRRVVDIVKEVRGDKNVLLVTHGDVFWMAESAFGQKSESDSFVYTYPEKAEVRELKLRNVPYDENGAINPHRPYIDSVTLECPECKDSMTRVKELCDVWFDSGAMPFAAGVGGYPADYISEAIDQTRGWFYTLLAVATLLDKEAPYKNVICLGHILDAKGQKMSKSKGNVVDPWTVMNKHGADALRFHFFTMNQAGEAKLFDEKNVGEVVRKTFMILWNVASFYELAGADVPKELPKPEHLLDRWLVAKLDALTAGVTKDLEAYDITAAGRKLAAFITELSTWYVRRSRARFKGEDDERKQAAGTLRFALRRVAELMAPFTPMVAEALYARLGGQESVHLAPWPETVGIDDEKLLRDMETVQRIVELGHALREEKKFRVRQPLQQLVVVGVSLGNEFGSLLLDELNVQEVHAAKETPSGAEWVSKTEGTLTVALDTTMTDELIALGWVREITRNVNDARKKGGLKPTDTPTLVYATEDARIAEVFERFGDSIKKGARLAGLEKGASAEGGETFPLGEGSVTITIR